MILFKVLFDYESEDEGDLTLLKYDIVEHICDVSENWYNGRNVFTNKTGDFPFNFVEKVIIPKHVNVNDIFISTNKFNGFDKGSIIVSVNVNSNFITGYVLNNDNSNDLTVEFPKSSVIKLKETANNFKKLMKCVAHSEHDPNNDNELKFQSGDIIWLMEVKDSEYGEGILNGNQGIFPLAKVNQEDMKAPASSDRKNRWVCVYDYVSDTHTDLNVARGENLRFIDRIDHNWFIMANESGQVGMVPSNFIKNISINSRPSLTNGISISNSNPKLQNQRPSLTPNILSQLKSVQANKNTENGNNGEIKENLPINTIIISSKEKNQIISPSKKNSDVSEPQSQENLLEILTKKEEQLLIDIETTSNDLQSIKNKLLKQSSISDINTDNNGDTTVDLNNLEMMKKNMAFLQEDHKLKLKELEMVKEQKDKAMSGTLKEIEQFNPQQLATTNGGTNAFSNIREKAIEELQITEKKFYEDIKATLEAFDLYTTTNKISDSEYSILFGDLDSVLSLSIDFYNDLTKTINCSIDEVCIGHVILEYIAKFDLVYKEYCLNYDKKLEMINKKLVNSDIIKYINEGLKRLNDSGNFVPALENMLIKPFQRFLKYSLFLKTIKSNTPEHHPDYFDIDKALVEFDIMTKKCNEKKRFEEIKTTIFDKGEQLLVTKALHGLQKVPKRLVASICISSNDHDQEYMEIIARFKNLEKYIGFLIETIIILKVNLKEIINLYSSITNSLLFVAKSPFGSLLQQYMVICKDSEIEYDKTYTAKLETMVIRPLTQLLDLFAGPKLLIKKRQSKYLDYIGAKQKLDGNSRESNRMLSDKVEDLKNQYNVVNNTLKEELPILTSKSTVLLHECLANYLELTTSSLAKSIENISQINKSTSCDPESDVPLCRNQQHDIIVLIQRNMKSTKYLSQGRTMQNYIEGTFNSAQRNEVYCQTEQDVENLKKKYQAMNLMIVKKDFKPTKNHQVCVCAGNTVGIVKRSDPQGHSSNWLVEISLKRMGFVPRSYLDEPEIKPQSLRGNVRSLSVKLPNNTRPTSFYFDDKHYESMRFASRASCVSAFEDNESNNNFFPNPTKKVVNALYQHQSRGQSEISINKGDKIQLLREQDDYGNKEWCFVKNLNSNSIGYVPTNYLSKS